MDNGYFSEFAIMNLNNEFVPYSSKKEILVFPFRHICRVAISNFFLNDLTKFSIRNFFINVFLKISVVLEICKIG